MMRVILIALSCCFSIVGSCSVSKKCWGPSGCTVQVKGASAGGKATVTVGNGGSISNEAGIWNAQIKGHSGSTYDIQAKYGDFGFNLRGTNEVQVKCDGGGGGHGGGGGGGNGGGKKSYKYHGDGTSYGNNWEGHNCGYTDLPVKAKTYFVALDAPLWNKGANCGKCIRVHCTDPKCKGTETIDVMVTDQCPAPCAHGDLDLSDIGFKELTGSTPSRYEIGWDWIDCKEAGFVRGNIEIYQKDGTHQWWYAFQPRNIAKPVVSMSLKDASGKVMKLQGPGEHHISTYFYLGTESSAVTKPFTLILHSVDGQNVEVKVDKLWGARNTLKTNVQFT